VLVRSPTVASQTGFLDSFGSPRISVRISGEPVSGTHKDFDALIDTGFTGFVLMPLQQAIEVGCTFYGTTFGTLADKSNAPFLLATGFASIGLEPAQHGVIFLHPSQSDVLVGMDFLRTMKKTLSVAPLVGTVTLADA